MVRDSVEEYVYVGDNPRLDLLELVPPGTATALDVGCGRGGFCRTLKANGVGEVWGIEAHPDAAAEVTADRVVCGFFPQDMPADAPLFDLISFGDVLEHIEDPLTVLRGAAERLSPGGVVLASIPNLRYWRVLWNLYWHGDFTYKDQGILDRTHLRFFTRSTMRKLFTDAGLTVDRMDSVTVPEGRKAKLLNRLVPRLGADSLTYQYLLRGSVGGVEQPEQ